MQASPLVGVPATARAITPTRLPMKIAEVGCFAMASTNIPVVPPTCGPFTGGVLMQIVFAVALFQSPVEQVPENPFAEAALHAAVLAESVE